MEKQELARLESQIKSVKTAHVALGNSNILDELIKVIHHPGWTTPAELALVLVSIESIQTQTAQLNALTSGLLSAAQQVGASRAAGV